MNALFAVNPNVRDAPGLIFALVAALPKTLRVAVEAPSTAFQELENPVGKSNSIVQPSISVGPLFVMTMSALKPVAHVGVRRLKTMVTGAVCAPATMRETNQRSEKKICVFCIEGMDRRMNARLPTSLARGK